MATTMRDDTQTRTAIGCCGEIVTPNLTATQAAEYAGWFKALADPTRIRILNLLARNDAPVGVGQATVSHHLKVLRAAGLVAVDRRGIWAHYEVAPDLWDWLRATLAQGAENNGGKDGH